jgi:molybdate transport system substrate-binding protein
VPQPRILAPLRRPGSATVLAAAAALLLAGCGGGGAAAGAPAGTRTLTVSAASSLTDVFGTLEPVFEAAHPGVDVVYNFGGSSDLAAQIVNGAPADVFASANRTPMTTVADAGLVAGEPAVVVTNRLQIAVAPGNPEGVRGFADLAAPGLTLVVCAPAVPCGAATEQVERVTGVTLSPVSEAENVRDVLSQVATGNADAGLVYVTDVASAGGEVEGVAFPESSAAVNEYPVAALTGAPQPEAAAEFVAFVQGAEARAVFEAAGFGTP